MIEARGVSKSFGNQVALENIDLDVPAGAIVGLIGPSGCGKTTLVKLLTGIARPTSGEIRVFGEDPTRFDTDQRRRFGYMPQLPVLFPNLTVWGNMSFLSSVYGMSIRHRRRRLMQLLDLVDLSQHRRKRLADCSGGMQRRVSLAATLVHDPELLYLDEPTAGVDPILRERLWGHFRDLRDGGTTIVVPTQYVGEAVSCDLVAVMANGRLITIRPPDQLARFAFGGDPMAVEVADGWLSRAALEKVRAQPFVRDVRRSDDGLTVVVEDAEIDVPRLRSMLDESGVSLGEITAMEPSFDDIFVHIIESHTSEAERVDA